MAVKQKLKSDGEAAELWLAYGGDVRKLCAYKLQSCPDKIEDCVQDVFLDLCTALNSGKQLEYPKAWLLKVAGNKIKDIYTQSNRERERLVSIHDANLENTLSENDSDAFFKISEGELEIIKSKVINSLSDEEKALLIDRYRKNKTVVEIAAELKTTENNVYQRLFRLRQKVEMKIKIFLEN